MRVISKTDLIATVAERYREAYQRRGRWISPIDGRDPAAVYAALQALAPNASEQAVGELTGDGRWTVNLCDECGQDKDVTVLFAEEDNHPTDGVQICIACLQAGLQLATRSG